ncbi:hypothetical protein PMZ80_008735 [Knufia obscura]|nr:hypothetical protein PMZ80_008735 [Knufia obscura]
MESAILHRSLGKAYPTAVSGQGVYLITDNGQKILDGSSGAAVSSLGHGNTEVIEAVVTQARNLSFAHTSFFTSDPAEELARVIIDRSNGAFSKVTFLSSGSEAVETALKIARQHHIYNGEPERIHIIGRMHAYHGNTLGALAAGNNPPRRDAFSPLLSSAFHHVSRCFYDADGQGMSEGVYEDRLISEIESKIETLGPKTVAAMIVEPVGGATLGSVPPTRTYLPRLKDLCSRYGILLIFDEVMCGMGRVGSYHAWQQLGGVAPDLQTIGKGLGAGYQPLSAVLLAPKVVAAFEEGSKKSLKFTSGHTFQGHSMGCAGALAVHRILKRDQLISHVGEMGMLLESVLQKGLLSEINEYAVSMRGMGLFRTVDFGRMQVALGGPLAQEVADETFRRGAAVYTCSPAVDAILFAPPFIITAKEVAELSDIFVSALRAVTKRRKGSKL